MINKARNKSAKAKKEEAAEKKQKAAQRKEVLRTRYSIGKPPKHYGANR